MDANGKDLVEFWNWAADRGEMNRNTAAAMRSACKEVLSTVEPEGWETVDLREIEVENFCQRFVRLRTGGNFKPESLSTYRARFKRALGLYLSYLEAPDKWQYEPATPEPKGSSEKASTRTIKKREHPRAQKAARLETDQAEMIEYPYPLRPWRGLRVSVTLPVDLTRQEAQRLAAFISSLAVDPQLALPAGGTEHREAS